MRVYKRCSKCKLEKTAIEFSKNKTRADGLNSWCKLCNKQFNKTWYKDNNPEHRRTIRERKNSYKNSAQRYVIEYLLEHPCECCGETNPVVLEFDHIDSNTKSFNIGELTSRVVAKDLGKLKAEMEKCNVLCANCHRLKTSKSLNHRRYVVYQQILKERK